MLRTNFIFAICITTSVIYGAAPPPSDYAYYSYSTPESPKITHVSLPDSAPRMASYPAVVWPCSTVANHELNELITVINDVTGYADRIGEPESHDPNWAPGVFLDMAVRRLASLVPKSQQRHDTDLRHIMRESQRRHYCCGCYCDADRNRSRPYATAVLTERQRRERLAAARCCIINCSPGSYCDNDPPKIDQECCSCSSCYVCSYRCTTRDLNACCCGCLISAMAAFIYGIATTYAKKSR